MIFFVGDPALSLPMPLVLLRAVGIGLCVGIAEVSLMVGGHAVVVAECQSALDLLGAF